MLDIKKITKSKRKYTKNEYELIKLELVRYLISRQEKVNDYAIDEWINSFKELNCSLYEAIKRIKIAKITRHYRYYTCFADFFPGTRDNKKIYNKKYTGTLKLSNIKRGLLK